MSSMVFPSSSSWLPLVLLSTYYLFLPVLFNVNIIQTVAKMVILGFCLFVLKSCINSYKLLRSFYIFLHNITYYSHVHHSSNHAPTLAFLPETFMY